MKINYICAICGKCFDTHNQLVKHLREHEFMKLKQKSPEW